jgi:hypothetical protein
MQGNVTTPVRQPMPNGKNLARCERAPEKRGFGLIAKCARIAAMALASWLCVIPAAVFAKTTPNALMQIAPAGSSVYGTKPIFYASVSSPTQGGPIPTGTINCAYRDASNSNYDLCDPVTITNPVQSCEAKVYLPAGADRIILIYSGDANYDGDATGALAQGDYVVTLQMPTIALDPPAPVFVGQYAALHLIVGNATQTQGLFSASIGGDNGTCSLANPAAVCSAGKTRFAGTFEVDAGFEGDANHGAVASAPVGQITILPAPTVVTILPPNPIALGDSVHIGMNIASLVDPTADAFQGDIVLSDGEVSCQVHLPGFGNNAACTLTPLSAGVRHLTATYSGYSNATASTGTADLTVVGPKVDGACGSDNGKTLTAPPTNLCSAGTASAVAGSGPWTWSCTGSNGGASANCSADVATSTSYTITTTVNPAGAGTVTCTPNPVASGSNSTCTAMANAGYTFANFSGDCNGVTCTLNNVAANKSVVANFTTAAQRPGTISVRGIANGDTTPSTADGTDFGSTSVGVPVTHGFTIDNLGAREASLPSAAQPAATIQAMPQADGDLIVTAITSSNPAFTVSGGVGTIAVGASAPFNVRFNATAAGTQTATITLASNDGHTPTYTFVVAAAAVATVTPGGVQAAPTLSNWMLGLLGGLLCFIALACARISRTCR